MYNYKYIIHTLSSVCLPYWLYFALFADLKRCAEAHNSHAGQVAADKSPTDCSARKLCSIKILTQNLSVNSPATRRLVELQLVDFFAQILESPPLTDVL